MKWFKINPGSAVPQDITKTSMVIKHAPEHLPTGHTAREATLKLKNVKQSDRGEYLCWKSNGYNATANISIIIDVAGKLTKWSGPVALSWNIKGDKISCWSLCDRIYRAIFQNCVSKIIRECFGFASLHSVISPRKNSRHHLLQSAVNFVTWLPAFSRVLGSLLSFTLVAVISLVLVLRLSVEKRPLMLCKCNG